MNSNLQFSGLGVALITPMHSDGSIDVQGLKNIVNHIVEGGADYLVVLGTTGETSTLSREDQRLVINTTIDENKGRLPIVIGALAGNDTQEQIRAIQACNLEGISGLLIASPSYTKPTQEGLYQHYKALDAISPLPIILYNVPGRTASNITWETTVRIAQDCKNIVGIKEASGDMKQGTCIIKHCPENFTVLSGDDETGLALMACGGHGIISVIGNVYPKQWADMVHAAQQGDYAKASKINRDLYDVHTHLYIEGNPAGIKAAAKIKGLCDYYLRLPLLQLSDPNYQKLKEEMSRI